MIPARLGRATFAEARFGTPTQQGDGTASLVVAATATPRIKARGAASEPTTFRGIAGASLVLGTGAAGRFGEGRFGEAHFGELALATLVQQASGTAAITTAGTAVARQRFRGTSTATVTTAATATARRTQRSSATAALATTAGATA